MIFVALLVGVAFYVVLYLLFVHASTPLSGIDSWLRAFQELLFVPQDLVFFVLRGLLFLALVYVVADAFLSARMRTKTRRARGSRYTRTAR